MKKILPILIGMTVLSLSGCGKTDTNELAHEEKTVKTESADISEDTNIPEDECNVPDEAVFEEAPPIEDENPVSENEVPEDNVSENDILSDNPSEDPDNGSSDEDANDNPSEEDENSDDSSDEPFVSENHDAIVDLTYEKEEMISSDELGAFDKTHDVYELNKQIAELNCYDFSNTKITFLGDSITYGVGGDYNEYQNLKSYVDYVRDILGCQTKNLGIPGSCLSSCNGYEGMVYRVNDIPEDTNIIVVFGGINDFLIGDETFGDENFEEGTFTGDTRKTFLAIKNKFPDVPVYVITMYKNRGEAEVKSSKTLNDYMHVERVCANEAGFKIVELYSNDLMNNIVFENFAAYSNDIIHPNDNGYMWLGRHLAAEIVSDFN